MVWLDAARIPIGRKGIQLLQEARVVVAKHHICSALLYQMPDAQWVGTTRKGVSG